MSNRPRRWVFVALFAVFLSLGIGFLAWRFPDRLQNTDAQIKLVYATLLLSVFLLPSLFYQRIKARNALKSAAIWISIAVVLFVGYAYRDESKAVLQRLTGELLPGSAQIMGTTTSVRRGRDGHFAVEAVVDGVLINLLIDTGASDIVLSPRDAERLGFDITKLNYSKTYRTANGEVKGAPVRLGMITLGSIQIADIAASVNGAALNRSLLGMGFLERLSNFQIKGNNLIMTQ